MNPTLQPGMILILTLCGLAIAGYSGWKSTQDCARGVRLACTALRMSLILLLALIASNPGRWVNQRDLAQPEWSLLIDASASMELADADGADGASRHVRARELADQLKKVPEVVLNESSFSADAPTDLFDAGIDAVNRYRGSGKNLRGLIYLSDGIQVVPAEAKRLVQLSRAQGAPIYGHLIGGPVKQKDLVIETHRRQYTSFAGQEQKVTARVSNRGLGDIQTVVRLMDEDGKEIRSVELALKDGATSTVELQTPELTAGYHTFVWETDLFPEESLSGNNRSLLGINVLDSRINVLLMEGIPHWDNKFLIQLLRQQRFIDLTTVHRLTNERYFRVDTGDGDPIEVAEAVFPDDEPTIAAFDVIILGKGAEYYLTAARIQLLKSFVRERGGTLLFARGRPYTGSMPELEPLEPVEWGELIQADIRWKPTEAGARSGLFGPLLPGIDDDIWTHLAPVIGAYRAPKVKPFAQVLVQGHYAAAADAKIPMVISRRYGQGMILAVNAEGLWRWDFFPTFQASGALYRDFWTQMVQWSATHADFLPGHDVAIELNQSLAHPGQAVLARFTARGPERTEDALPFTLKRIGGEVVERTAQKSGASTWNAVLALDEPGAYTLAVDNQILNALTIHPLPDEQAKLSMDETTLAALAEQTGGALLSPDALEELIQPPPPTEHTEDTGQAIWQPRWASSALLLIIAILAGLEWIIRRRHGKL